MSSSAPIVPTKVLGDPEELERHLAMHQNGGFQPAEQFAANASDSDVNVAMPPSDGFDDGRFIFTPPTLELQQSDVQLHASFLLLLLLLFFVSLAALLLTDDVIYDVKLFVGFVGYAQCAWQ